MEGATQTPKQAAPRFFGRWAVGWTLSSSCPSLPFHKPFLVSIRVIIYSIRVAIVVNAQGHRIEPQKSGTKALNTEIDRQSLVRGLREPRLLWLSRFLVFPGHSFFPAYGKNIRQSFSSSLPSCHVSLNFVLSSHFVVLCADVKPLRLCRRLDLSSLHQPNGQNLGQLQKLT